MLEKPLAKHKFKNTYSYTQQLSSWALGKIGVVAYKGDFLYGLEIDINLQGIVED